VYKKGVFRSYQRKWKLGIPVETTAVWTSPEGDNPGDRVEVLFFDNRYYYLENSRIFAPALDRCQWLNSAQSCNERINNRGREPHKLM
jgi:hypothetical protein